MALTEPAHATQCLLLVWPQAQKDSARTAVYVELVQPTATQNISRRLCHGQARWSRGSQTEMATDRKCSISGVCLWRVSLGCVSGVFLWGVSLRCVTGVCLSGVCLWGVSLEGCLWGVSLGCVTEVCHWGLSPECVSEVCLWGVSLDGCL